MSSDSSKPGPAPSSRATVPETVPPALTDRDPADAPPPPAPTVRDAAAPGQPQTPPHVPGYEIERVLGRGGMGLVYLARQTGLDRAVALKVILHADHAGPEVLARFRAE